MYIKGNKYACAIFYQNKLILSGFNYYKCNTFHNLSRNYECNKYIIQAEKAVIRKSILKIVKYI